jgi:hypothetical protein
MASPIEDVTSLPGETVSDQDGLKIGKVKRLYSVGDDDSVMWVTVETSMGVANKREVFVPLARLKQEHDEIRVPYSTQHLQASPEVEAGEELSEGDDRSLRDYYAIDLADQELRTDNEESYGNQVPDEEGTPREVDSDQAQNPLEGKGDESESPQGKGDESERDSDQSETDSDESERD